MPIVAHLGNNSKEYDEVRDSYWPEKCPYCGGSRMHRNGGYWRKVEAIDICCFSCNDCNRSFSVLPDFLKPYQAHSVPVEEKSILMYTATLGSCAKVADQMRK